MCVLAVVRFPGSDIAGDAYLTFENDVFNTRVASNNESRNKFTSVVAVVKVAVNVDCGDNTVGIWIMIRWSLTMSRVTDRSVT